MLRLSAKAWAETGGRAVRAGYDERRRKERGDEAKAAAALYGRRTGTVTVRGRRDRSRDCKLVILDHRRDG